jgi:hypothetical protein
MNYRISLTHIFGSMQRHPYKGPVAETAAAQDGLTGAMKRLLNLDKSMAYQNAVWIPVYVEKKRNGEDNKGEPDSLKSKELAVYFCVVAGIKHKKIEDIKHSLEDNGIEYKFFKHLPDFNGLSVISIKGRDVERGTKLNLFGRDIGKGLRKKHADNRQFEDAYKRAYEEAINDYLAGKLARMTKYRPAPETVPVAAVT